MRMLQQSKWRIEWDSSFLYIHGDMQFEERIHITFPEQTPECILDTTVNALFFYGFIEKTVLFNNCVTISTDTSGLHIHTEHENGTLTLKSKTSGPLHCISHHTVSFLAHSIRDMCRFVVLARCDDVHIQLLQGGILRLVAPMAGGVELTVSLSTRNSSKIRASTICLPTCVMSKSTVCPEMKVKPNKRKRSTTKAKTSKQVGPKRPRTGYILFTMHMRKTLGEGEMLNMTIPEASKLIAKRWRELDKVEIEKWRAAARDDIKRYEAERAQIDTLVNEGNILEEVPNSE